MNQERIRRITEGMKARGMDHLLISDPVAIFYLLGRKIAPGERMLVLYLHAKGGAKLVINELFPQEGDVGVDLIWYNDVDDGVAILAEAMEEGDTVGIDKNWPSHFLLRLQEIFPEKRYVNGSILVDDVRRIKDEEEQEIMRESSKICDEVMEALIPRVVKGLTEKEMDAKVRELFAERGVTEMSFDPITAYGRGGADPHHATDDSKGKRGDSVVLDIGGMYKNYASDMTRTVFIGEVSDKAREVYEIVKEANLRGIAAAKPGNRMCDVDKACRDYITSKGYGDYFTHRTGHSIGLEDHEVGDVSSANDAVIQPGQVFSVEPGIYLLDEGIGVRIEDLVLITEEGCEVLNQVTKDLIVVEEEDDGRN